MGHTRMKRAKSELFKYSNISTDHLSLFAWSYAFIYVAFTCFIYMFIPICTVLPQAPTLPTSHTPPTTNVQRQRRPPLSHTAPTPTSNEMPGHDCATSQTKRAQTMSSNIVWALGKFFLCSFHRVFQD